MSKERGQHELAADQRSEVRTRETLFYQVVADGVVLLTLNRPEHGNAVVPEMARDLITVLAELEADRTVRCLVITGAGQQFSAGADLIELRRFLDERLMREHEPYNARELFPVTQRLASSRLATVAAINGGATAGGLDLALACDIRVASRKAKLGETYINVGLPPGNGGTWFLPRLVGSGMAAELALTGDVVDAEHALAIGLVNRVLDADQLLPASIELAARIATKPWRAIEATKQALRSSWQQDLQAAINANYWAVLSQYYTGDVREGVEAFLEKRPPRFNREVTHTPFDDGNGVGG